MRKVSQPKRAFLFFWELIFHHLETVHNDWRRGGGEIAKEKGKQIVNIDAFLDIELRVTQKIVKVKEIDT